jgi:anti-sigma factor ChrR (cupin superfamily)
MTTLLAVAIHVVSLQALEAARKLLQKREAELAEATAESEAAAGEREQIKEQVAASEATIQGTRRLPACLCNRHHCPWPSTSQLQLGLFVK